MNEKVNVKQEAYKALISNGIEDAKDVTKVRYKLAKWEAKSAITVAKK